MKNNRTVYQDTVTTINTGTGEVLSTTATRKMVREVEPEFVKLYVKDLLCLKSLPNSLSAVLFRMVQEMNYDGLIILSAGLKRIMAKDIGMALDTVNQAITKFVKSDIFLRRDTGVYLVNPYLFGKGDWAKIKSIRMSIDYTLDGKAIQQVDIDEIAQEEMEAL